MSDTKPVPTEQGFTITTRMEITRSRARRVLELLQCLADIIGSGSDGEIVPYGRFLHRTALNHLARRFRIGLGIQQFRSCTMHERGRPPSRRSDLPEFSMTDGKKIYIREVDVLLLYINILILF